MTTDLTKHAEAILRAAGLYAEFYIGHRGAERQAILTACATLFDAGAEAMREEASARVAYSESSDWGNPLDSACNAITSIDPASLRGA